MRRSQELPPKRRGKPEQETTTAEHAPVARGPGFEGKPIEVVVYCADEQVELIQDGRSLGKKPCGRDARLTATFETTYTAGELVAVGYDRGKEVSRSVLTTVGVPTAIRLTPDRSTLSPDFGDLSFVTVEVVDEDGNRVPNAGNLISFAASGAGSLIAVGNGDPRSTEMYVG